jgi:hypothetical protein
MSRPVIQVPRPLIQKHIAELEELFAKNKTDMNSLKLLERELGCRKVPRAQSLLAEVQSALKLVKSGAIPIAAPLQTAVAAVGHSNKQSELWSSATSSPPSVAQPVKMPPPAMSRTANSSPPPQIRETSVISDSTKTKKPLPEVNVAYAYGTLKSKPGCSWESLEMARRQIVQQASPAQIANMNADQRARVKEAASQANAAYRFLQATLIDENL